MFIGIGDIVEDNWRLRINAVDKVLSSWRSRSLSFRSKRDILVPEQVPNTIFNSIIQHRVVG